MTSQTQPMTPMKRAGQLIAHLGVLHQISDVRQLLLLQLVMQGRQDQVALFHREQDTVTLNLLGSQAPLASQELTHRAGNVPAAQLFSQLQTLSGIQGNDVAFSSAQVGDLIAARTKAIEDSGDLAGLDAALNAMMARAVQDSTLNPPPPHAPVQETAETAPESAPETQIEHMPEADGQGPDDSDSHDFGSHNFNPEDENVQSDEDPDFPTMNGENPFLSAEEIPAETAEERVDEPVDPDNSETTDEHTNEMSTPAQPSSRRSGRKAS